MTTPLALPARSRAHRGVVRARLVGSLAALVTTLLVGAGLVWVPAASAAAPSTVVSGSAAWGYKQSFRSYVGKQTAAMPPTTALPAGQRITLTGGATFDANGTPADATLPETRPYLFSVTSGSFTDAANLSIATTGIVNYHFPSHCFEAKVGDPSLVITGGVATLRGHLQVDLSNTNPMLCADYGTPTTAGGANVLIGTATPTVTVAPDGSSVTVALSGLTLSAEGAAAMQGFAATGDVLDTFTVTAALHAPVPDAPTLTVSATSNTSALDPAGTTLTVTGTNVRTDFANAHGAGKAGVYAQIGYLDSDWRPSAGAPAAARTNAYSIWVKESAPSASYLAWTDNGDGTADYTWQIRIDKATLDTKARPGATLAVFMIGGGGVPQAVNELAVPIAFAGPAATVTTLTAASATPILGDVVTLHAAVTPANAGSVTFTAGATDLGTVAVSSDGEATVETASLPLGAHDIRAVFTPADALHFAGSEGVTTVTVAAKPVIGAGSLTWGIKQSFRSYVVGSIAKGSISATGAGSAGGAFVFGQAAGGSFDGTTGTSNYSGSVRFLGHHGDLDLTIGKPVVRVESATSATLLVSVNGSAPLAFATLNLAAASRSTANNTVAYANVPATLTAQGAAAFTYAGSQFYPAGTALDPVSFVIGSASTSGSGTRVLTAFFAPPAVPSTPPATTGLELDPASAHPLVAGGEITVTAEGFRSGETGIKAVIYSEPNVLDEKITADATGRVTWTGTLPAGLTGQHTLTLQGSVARGLVLDIAADTAPASAGGCPVTSADLTWGFKEEFRSYISGSIAKGQWTTADGATYATPNFSWRSGIGAFDPETGEGLLGFEGAVTFTGHGGILNTTISNPQVRFDSTTKATLLLDVSGTTQEGAAVDQKGVEFASIDLAAAQRSVDGRTLTFAAAPAVLLAAGSDAFGTYDAGETLDPITVSLVAGEECGEIVIDTPTEAPVVSDGGTDVPWWLLGGIVVLVILAILGAVFFRKARQS